MGVEKSVKRFCESYDIGLKYTTNTLKNFMGFGEMEKQSPLTCIEIRVNGMEPYCGQPIKSTGIQSKEQCMIIGIERNGESMQMPDANMIIDVGDIIWVVGADANVNHLASMSVPKAI